MLGRGLRSSLLKHSTLYVVANFINSSIPFFLIPFLTTRLPPDNYGQLALFTAFLNLMIAVIGFSQNANIAKTYFEQDLKSFRLYFSNSLLLITAIAITLIVISLIVVPFLSTPNPVFSRSLIIITVVISWFQSIFRMYLSVAQIENKPIEYGGWMIFFSLLSFILTVIIISNYDATWFGRVLAIMFANIIIGCLVLINIWKRNLLIVNYNTNYFSQSLKFGAQLFPHIIGAVSFSITDKYIISSFINLEQTGYYALGYQISSIFLLFTTSVNKAYMPWLFKRLKSNNSRDKIMVVRITYIYFILIWIAAAIFIVFALVASPFLFDEKYVEALKFIPWITIGFAFNGMYLIVTNIMFYSDKRHLLGYVTLLIAIINIPLNFTLSYFFSTIGVAYATALIYAIYFFLTWYTVQSIGGLPWSNLKLLWNDMKK